MNSLILERQSGEKILAARNDGAPEILKLYEWLLNKAQPLSKQDISLGAIDYITRNQSIVLESSIKTEPHTSMHK